MGKVWIEVSLISARGLSRSSLWKLQWFAVGWIDPKNKYCTRIDVSGNSNPVWKTKFATLIDSSGSDFQDLALHIEVYSREPIFLRESLQGTATIALKEFLSKHSRKDEGVYKKAIEEVGSYQLRKRNSSKPQGFVDVSIRISEEGEMPNSSYSSGNGGIVLMDQNNNQMTLAMEKDDDGSGQNFPGRLPITRRTRENRTQAESSAQHFHDIPIADTNYHNFNSGGRTYPPSGASGYRTPPPPPPPSQVGFVPTFIPRTENLPAGNYMSTPSTRGPGFVAGLGAGALAAGAVIFGEDFMSGFDVPVGSRDPSLTVSLDPPF